MYPRIDGDDAGYPEAALQAELESLRGRVEETRRDRSTPDTRMADDPNHLNPAATEVLTELMLGGLPTGRVGFPLHSRLRYFDPARGRAGIPEDVAALVERLDAESVTVTLVNLSPIQARRV